MSIDGTSGNDVLNGTSSDDVIFGLAGDDTLNGLEGNDILVGGAGRDTLNGAGGNDVLVADGESDLANGGTGIDTFVADFSDVTLAFSQGPTFLPDSNGGYRGVFSTPNPGPINYFVRFTSIEKFDLVMGLRGDVITLGNGNDALRGGGGNDVLNTAEGNDLVGVSGEGQATVNGGAGTDTLEVDWADALGNIVMAVPTASASGLSGELGDGDLRRVAYSQVERFAISTGAGNDVVRTGGPGLPQSADVVDLGGGNDLFVDSHDGDIVNGGGGEDGIDLALDAIVVTVTWNLQTDAKTGFAGSYLGFEYFASLKLGIGADEIVTTAAERTDLILLGGGDDAVTLFNGQDEVDGQGGNDLLVLDYRPALTSVITVGGGAGIIAGSDGGVQGEIRDGATRSAQFDNIERFEILTGAANDTIVLGTGANVTDDIVSLGGGDDLANLGRGVDQADGGFGIDGLAADLSTVSAAINIDLAGHSYSGPAGSSYVNFEYFYGTGLLTGGGNDVVVTADLNLDDVVSLGGGGDRVTVFNGNDDVSGGGGTDTLVVDYRKATSAVVQAVGPDDSGSPGSYSGNFTDGATRVVTYQGFERFELHGGLGGDSLKGGAAADLLDGGLGGDLLTGGAGADIFFYSGVADSASGGVDTISGFDYQSDVIDLNFAVASYAGTASGALSTGTFDADIAAAMSSLPSGLGAHQAAVFNATSGSESGATYLIIDANGSAGYQAGQDYVIRMTNLAQPIGATVSYFASSARSTAAVAIDDRIAANEAAIVTGNVFANNGAGADYDPDGSPLQVGAVNGSSANVGTQIQLASGALLTVNADGWFAYDPNHAFDDTPATGSGASNPPVQDGFSYTLTSGAVATVTLTIGGADSDDYLIGSVSADFLVGGIGQDILFGLAGNDTLIGQGGNDRLDGGTGADGMYGGSGDDIYFFDSSGDFAVEPTGEGDDVAYTSVSYALNPIWEVEVLAAIDPNGMAAIDLYGNELDNELRGNAAANFLVGGAGGDALIGLAGNDLLSGEAGADYLEGGLGGDALIGGNGDDTMVGGAGNDYLDGGADADGMYGGTGDDIYFFDNFSDFAIEFAGEGNDRIYATFSFALVAGAEIELVAPLDLAGTASLDFSGNELGNTIWGGNGANNLTGFAGDDVLIGFAGNDVLLGGAGSDYLSGDAGDDVIAGGTQNDMILGGDGNDYLTGDGGSDFLVGGAGNDTLDGGTDDGADTLSGEAGDDTYFAGDSNENIAESVGGGNDIVYVRVNQYGLTPFAEVEILAAFDRNSTGIQLTGNEFGNQLWGTNGFDALKGNGGNDVLLGFDSDDRLVGNSGNDYLDGGSGADRYQFTNLLGPGNVDTIASFVSGTDKIELDWRFFSGMNSEGQINPNAFVIGTAAVDADDRLIYDQAAGQLYWDADANGSGAAILFATVAPGTTIVATDIFGTTVF